MSQALIFKKPSREYYRDMANNFDTQKTAIKLRLDALQKAHKDDSDNGMGTNAFVYDHLIAVNEDLLALYSGIAETRDFASKLPAQMSDAQRRRPSGR